MNEKKPHPSGCGAISTNAGSLAIYLYDKRNGKAFLLC